MDADVVKGALDRPAGLEHHLGATQADLLGVELPADLGGFPVLRPAEDVVAGELPAFLAGVDGLDRAATGPRQNGAAQACNKTRGIAAGEIGADLGLPDPGLALEGAAQGVAECACEAIDRYGTDIELQGKCPGVDRVVRPDRVPVPIQARFRRPGEHRPQAVRTTLASITNIGKMNRNYGTRAHDAMDRQPSAMKIDKPTNNR